LARASSSSQANARVGRSAATGARVTTEPAAWPYRDLRIQDKVLQGHAIDDMVWSFKENNDAIARKISHWGTEQGMTDTAAAGIARRSGYDRGGHPGCRQRTS
jgi:hypothetical protein